MKSFAFKIALFLTLFYSNIKGQVAACVHGTGIPYLLDALSGALGACNCEKSAVYLYTFPSCNNNPYKIEFEDNFDGSSLDTTKWGIQPWGQGALKESIYMEVNLLDNVSVSNGICYITAKKETVQKKAVNWRGPTDTLEDGLPNLRTYYYTSSNLWTKPDFFHGKYEIRCRMPKGNGFWPAFWMFGGKRWNEIDVFDSYSGTQKLITSIGHDFDGTGKSNGCNSVKSSYDLSDWHTYSCVYDFDKISFFVDEELIRTINRIYTINGQPVNCGDEIGVGTYYQLKSYPLEKMSIIMNLALIRKGGGSFIAVDDSTPFPSSLEVDYVRKWNREPFIEYLSIFPNPTNGIFSLNTNVSFISSLFIFNTNGQAVYQSQQVDVSKTIDLSTFPDGVYFVKAITPEGSKTFKFMKINN